MRLPRAVSRGEAGTVRSPFRPSQSPVSRRRLAISAARLTVTTRRLTVTIDRFSDSFDLRQMCNARGQIAFVCVTRACSRELALSRAQFASSRRQNTRVYGHFARAFESCARENGFCARSVRAGRFHQRYNRTSRAARRGVTRDIFPFAYSIPHSQLILAAKNAKSTKKSSVLCVLCALSGSSSFPAFSFLSFFRP